MVDSIKLKVVEAHQDDVNKGIVRIDSDLLSKISVRAGEPVGIEGDKSTIAIADRCYPLDSKLRIIRMDGISRKNAKVSLGDVIEIFKPEIKEATKITLTPIGEFNAHPATIANVKKGFFGKCFAKGDIIIPAPVQERKHLFSKDNLFGGIDILIENEILGANLSSMKFKVKNNSPNSEFLVISSNTDIIFSSSREEEESSNLVNYEDIGGLKNQISKIRELVDLPLKYPEIFARLGIEAPKGILLYGPPGTGKTLIAKAIANESEASFHQISAPEIINKYYGESEKKLRELFAKAKKESPSIIFIDEIDAIAVQRDKSEGETEKRVVTQLLTLMDGLNSSGKVIVMAATNRPEVLDDAIRRAGRFDRELEIGIPKADERLEILKIHTRSMPLKFPKITMPDDEILEFVLEEDDENLDFKKFKKALKKDRDVAIKSIPVHLKKKIQHENFLEKIVDVTSGFVGSDLSALVKEAAFSLLRRKFPNITDDMDEEILQETISKLRITLDDFKEALKVVRPSALREFVVEVPNVSMQQVGGLSEIKQNLKEMIDWPFSNPEAFKRLGIKSPKGILMYGPPGTGKTLIAKAVATDSALNFIYIKSPDLLEGVVGETEKKIKKLFKKARQNSPSIIFFDEIDAIASKRFGGERTKHSDTVVNQILTEMDGLEDLVDVKILAATNRPTIIDSALLRPGRFDKLVLVDIPNIDARKEIIKINLKETPVVSREKLIVDLADKTQGFVGADIEALVREAGLIALRRDLDSQKVLAEDFTKALDVVKASVTDETKKYYSQVEIELKSPKVSDKKELSIMDSYM
jgi:transitional endoplasmic reticulum ATPase